MAIAMAGQVRPLRLLPPGPSFATFRGMLWLNGPASAIHASGFDWTE